MLTKGVGYFVFLICNAKGKSMSHISPIALEEAAPGARKQLEDHVAKYGRATNMKRTLARSPTALHAYMHWYDLHAEVVSFLGERSAMLFAHAISSQTDCLICSTFFRRWLIQANENPDALQLSDREQAIVDYGRQLAKNANGVSEELMSRMKEFLQPDQLVTLTAFGGLMVATNLFNNALKIDLDEYLYPFRKGTST
jgi:alkylhydroperoxidase family enzyme